MADIHLSKQYEKLIRRVGYSVGLEELVQRINCLVDLYVEHRDINIALWKQLVQNVYRRKISDQFEAGKWGGSKKTSKKLGAEDHFADFYSELNLLFRQNNQVFPLYGLEILSILRRYYWDNNDKYLEASRGLLTLFILEADGDIFLNCLLGNFAKKEVKQGLTLMFKEKKQKYSKVYLNTYSRNQLSLLFKVQSSTSTTSIFKKAAESKDIDVPDEYLSKILPTRKGWAAELGFFADSLQERGLKLLSFLSRQQIVNEKYAAFYAYTETHKVLFVEEEKAGIHSIYRKDFIRDFFYFYWDNVPVSNDEIELRHGYAYRLLFRIMELYKEGNKVKSIIRHQLPFQILYPVFYIISALDNQGCIDLGILISQEQKSADRKIDVVHLRGNELEGALTLKS
jgi:hypothetical protein